MRRKELLLLIACAATLFGANARASVTPAAGITDTPTRQADALARVLAVIKRTKTTRATYAIYTWIWLKRGDNTPAEEWSAEFNSGVRHRVETPRDRLIADCEALNGTAVSLPSGETHSGRQVADAACGIDTVRAVDSAQWLGTVSTPCGKADRVRLISAELVRTYDITADGIIAATTYARNVDGEPPILVTKATTCSSELPLGSLFDQPSLQQSYVPAKFKLAPALAH